jgi:GAF domain-containing protein
MRDISTRKAAEADREALLAEVQATIRQYVHQQWEQFLGENYQGNWRVQHQDPHSELKEDVALLEQLQQAVLNRGETQILAGPHGNGHQGHAALVSPIPLRGQVIGTLSLEDIDPDRNWGEDEIALVEAVSEQLALTIENLRLVENTQKRATREQLARQITDKMRTFPDADAIIQTGLDELAKALGVSRTYVKLNLAQSQGYSREQETGSREQEAGSI